jgi:two-component system CheB/CheR fusion protein
MSEMGCNVPVKILATDLDEVALQRARSGYFIENIALDVSPERLRGFFIRVNNHYQISKSIRQLCIFSRHNIVSDPPCAGLDLISCRNVMIYFDLKLQNGVISLFPYALRPAGHLLLGGAESIGSFTDLFKVVDKDQKFYEKKATQGRLLPDRDTGRAGAHLAARSEGESRGAVELQQEAVRLLLARYAPPGVLVDENLSVLQVSGRTGPFLEPAPESASLELQKLIRGTLLADLRAAFGQAKSESAPARRQAHEFRENDGFRQVAIEVHPLRPNASDPRHFLVLFIEETPAPTEAAPARALVAEESPVSAEAEGLRRKIEAGKNRFQALVEENEATKKELMAANEEIMSSNEELQGTNEELQTAKEERQSANEELETVNEELRHRNLELGEANDDLMNLILGLSMPIVMVSRDLRIRRFTPPGREGAEPDPVGRRAADRRPPSEIRGPRLRSDDPKGSRLRRPSREAGEHQRVEGRARETLSQLPPARLASAVRPSSRRLAVA